MRVEQEYPAQGKPHRDPTGRSHPPGGMTRFQPVFADRNGIAVGKHPVDGIACTRSSIFIVSSSACLNQGMLC